MGFFIRSKSIFFIFILFIYGCGSKGNINKKRTILTSIYPYYLLVKEIVGDKFDVKVLYPVKSSPHSYYLKPSDLLKVQNSSLIVMNGFNLEMSLDTLLKNKNQNKNIIRISDILHKNQLIKYNSHHAHEHLHHHQENSKLSNNDVDPHVWLSVANLEIISQKIFTEVVKIDPENKNFFKNNIIKMNADLDYVNKKIKSEVILYDNLKVITFHNSFNYFNRDYGIELLAVVTETPGREPTINQLVKLGEIIKKNSMKYIFIEPQLNRKSAEVIAKEFNLKIALLDPLGGNLSAEKVSDILYYNWTEMKKSFNKK